MKNTLRPLLVLFLTLSLITGLAYPLLVTTLAQALYPAQAAGSLLIKGGKPVGSALIGQSFADPGHGGCRQGPGAGTA
jgi:K+-transporting ATPase ATPase C chain